MSRNVWKHKVNIGDFWRDEDMSLGEKAAKIDARFEPAGRRVGGFAQDDLGDLMAELIEAGDADDVDWFDQVWSGVLDWADEHRVWIETWPTPQPARTPRPAAQNAEKER